MITTYEVGTTQYKALQSAARILTSESPTGAQYYVDDVYFDVGQGWMWTTIIAKRSNGDSWQALNPHEHSMITDDGSHAAILEAVRSVQKDKFNPDRIR